MSKPAAVPPDVRYRLLFRLAGVRGIPERELERLYDAETREFLLVEPASRRVLPCRNRAEALAELRRVDPSFRPDRLIHEEYRSPGGAIWKLQALDKHHTELVDWCREKLEAETRPVYTRAVRQVNFRSR